MKELESIVQRMMDAGESESKIREAVRIYKQNQKGKAKDSTVDPTMSQNDMGSELDDGFSASYDLPQVDVTASQEDNTAVERVFGKNVLTDFFGDLWRAGEQGLAQGATVDEAFDVYKKGKDISDEELMRYIEVSDALDKTGASDEMREYEEIKNEAGGGVWGFMKGMVMTRGQVIPQVIVSSAAAMGRTFFDSEEAAAAAGGGAAIAGTAGSFVPIVGTATGAIGGAVAGLTGSMETALTLTELLKTELGEKDFNKENIRAILENEEVFEDIKDRALARGATIGAVEGITVGLSRGVGAKLLKSGASKGKIARQVTGIETLGGSGGEALGQIAAGQEFDIAEVLMEGVAEAKGVVNVADILAKKEYKINGEKRTRKEVLDKVANTKAESLAKIQFEVTGDKNLKNLVNEKQGDAIFKTQIDERVEETDRNKLVELEKKRLKAETDKKKKGIFAVPGAEANLENVEGQIAEIIGRYEGADITDKTVQARKKTAQDVRSVYLEKTKSFAKVASEQMGFNPFESFKENSGFVSAMVERVMSLQKYTFDGVEVDLSTMTEAEIEAEANRIADSSNQADAVNIPTADGNQAIMINEEAAFKYGALQAGSHEVLHGVMKGALANLKALDVKDNGTRVKDLISDFKLNVEKNLGKNVVDAIEKRLKNSYGDTIDLETTDEWFTALSDIIEDDENNITYKNNKGFFDGIKDKVAGIFNKNTAYKNLSIETGEDAFNFMKAYSQNVKEGKLSERMLEFASGAEGELTGGKRVSKEGQVDETAAFSKTASDKVQSIYEEQGEAGAFEIIEQFKPIVSKIAEKRREAPNFDKELLMSEIEIGERGILDLISKYDPESGVPLAAYINKFLPSRAIEASRRVLGEEFTEDVSERVDIAAEEVAEVEVKAKPKKKKIVLADRLGVTEEVAKAIKKLMPKIDFNKETFKSLKNQIPEITGEMFGISPKKLISGANITKKELQSAQMFINKNADVLISMLPEGATASGTATGVPQTLLKAFYTKTDRAKMAKTGTKAGLAIQVKNDIKKTDFLETFGIIDGKPDRTDRNTSARVLALANQTGKMMTNQAVREQLFENITEENAKSMLKLSDGKSAIMFSKSKAKENNMPNIAKYFGEKTEAEVASVLDQHASLTEEQFKEAFPNEHGNVKNYIEDMAQFVADGGKEAMQFTKEMKGTNFGNSELTNYLKTGYWTLSDAKFKQDKKAMKWFVSNAHNLANQILLPKNATNGNMRMIMGFFAGHYNIVGSDMAKVGSVLKQGIVDRLNEKGKSVLSKETLSRWKNFDFENLKSSYASTFYTGLKKIYAANTLKEQKAIAKEYFTGKEGATQKDFYDLWNTTLEEWLHSNEVGSKEFNSKADYILKLKKANAAIGTTGERVMAPGGYVYLPGSIMDGKIKFEHLKSSSQQSKESALLVINNKFKEFGDLATEDYTGIYGPLELFNAVDDATGKVNSSNIFRLAGNLEAAKSIYSIDNLNQSLYGDIVSTIGKDKIKFLEQAGDKSQVKKLDKAIMFSRSANNETKGITVLDFDDTLATSKSLVISTSPDGVVRKLTAEEFATEGADLLDQGWTHDFSEFSKVVDGKVASLFKKAMKLQGKFGPENMFVLTARPADSAPAIFEFLKANGLNIPLKNITGLANSTAESKALWMAEKVGEGYNDFYFADDALQNVQAVKNMLDQFDVKSKVQQAKVKFSKSMNDQFNDILENVTGIESDKRFSIIKGRKRGEGKGKFRVFIPPSHEDFVGLLYNFLGKGKEGNAHRDFFEQALIRPLNRANREFDTARQSVANDYKELNKQFEDVRKKLTKKTADGDFTFQDAIRVYLWDKHGHKIPGLSETDQAKLAELVMSDPQLQAYAETLNVISKQETYVNPTDGWNGGDIRMDLDDATGRIGRKQFFSEFIENADVIFSEENLNKIEAGYGKEVRESLEDMLYRIQTGRNRPTGQNAQVNKLMNYLNGSVGTVMFFNMRSALLQQMSIVNYINFADNNIFAAAKAFANQKQYWKDFAFIFNSDMLKQRRGGIQTDVNGAELAASLRNSKDITRKLISKLLELGFLPTQIGDNIAIATGGAAYYRNRINKYIKQGMSQKEAEAAAFTDFQDITQSTQQSARPDMVSKQQASVIGKVILNFQNVTSQFNRLGKKAFQDIYNRRITKPNSTQMQSDISNAARITYYFAIQNAIFYTLQTALFAMMFDDDEEDNNKLFLKKKERLINGSIDSVLRGSGLIGGVVATLKNVAIAFARQRDAKYNPDESAVLLEALNLSPVLGIKGRKITNAEKTLNYNKKVIDEMETFDIDNPQWSSATNYTEALTNIPLNRLYNKTQNVRQALNNDHSAWERSLMFLGWSQYNLDLENKKMEEIKEKTKSKKKKKKNTNSRDMKVIVR